MSGPKSLQDVLKDLKSDFMNSVSAKEIAIDARREGIITLKVEVAIRDAATGPKHANDHMYEHLCSQATEETMRKLCRIMKDAQGCDKMNGFGQRLEAELDKIFPQQEEAATDGRLMQETSRRNRGAESEVASLPAKTHGPNSPKEPQVSFAILTANENEKVAVHHFLLGKPADTKKYPCAKGHTWSDDSFLIQTKAEIKPNESKSENCYRVFDLEVGEKRQRGVHVECDKMGPWGAFDTTVELLKNAKDKGWKIGCIFVTGCCGASVIDREKCPRGTVLLARQVKDYLNTGKIVEIMDEEGKVVERKLSGTAVNHPMSTLRPIGLCEFMNVVEADRRNTHKIEVQIVDFLTGPLVIKDDLFGKTYCEADAEVTGVEMEIVGVIKAVRAFRRISGDPGQHVVLAKGVSDYTGKKGEEGSCKLFGEETPPVDDDQLQMYATLQSLALVIRFVANNIPLVLDQST